MDGITGAVWKHFMFSCGFFTFEVVTSYFNCIGYGCNATLLKKIKGTLFYQGMA